MNGVIETLKFIDSNEEQYHLYPRTLVEAITNQDGESLESLLRKGGSGTGNISGTITAADILYDDNTDDMPFGADNVQDAFDNLKGILSTFDDYVNSKASETLDAAKAYTDENAGSGAGTHQFSISGKNLETGWYIIGRTMGMYSCNINIIDMGIMPGEEMPIFVQANVLSSEFVETLTSNVKILDVATFEGCAPYVGFDKIVTTTKDGEAVVVMHYTNPGYEEHNCILTITSLMGGELTFDDFSVNFGMQPYDGNTLTYLCDEFAEDARIGRISDFELKAQPDLADILARLEVLEAKGVSDILDPEGVEF